MPGEHAIHGLETDGDSSDVLEHARSGLHLDGHRADGVVGLHVCWSHGAVVLERKARAPTASADSDRDTAVRSWDAQRTAALQPLVATAQTQYLSSLFFRAPGPHPACPVDAGCQAVRDRSPVPGLRCCGFRAASRLDLQTRATLQIPRCTSRVQHGWAGVWVQTSCLERPERQDRQVRDSTCERARFHCAVRG